MRSISAIAISTNTATLTVGSIGGTNKVLTLSYTQAAVSNRFITDTSANLNALADFAIQSVTNIEDTTAPTVSSAQTTDATTVVITFDETIAAASCLETQFYVKIDSGSYVAATACTVSGTTATLTVGTMAQGQTLLVKYAKTSSIDGQYVTDTAGATPTDRNNLASFDNEAVTITLVVQLLLQ